MHHVSCHYAYKGVAIFYRLEEVILVMHQDGQSEAVIRALFHTV
jgi:hypothetical protein